MTLREQIIARAATCFLCRWTAEDLREHGKLTNWSPADGELAMSTEFPKGAKILHLKLEKFVDITYQVRILSVT